MGPETSSPHFVDRHVAALVTSFAGLPPSAIPAIIDCVLASSSLPPDALFSSLLTSFPNSSEAILSNKVLSHTTALCHLINHTTSPCDSLKLLIEQVLVPVLIQINSNESELLNQIIQLICNTASKHQAWGPLLETLIPLCLKSIYLKLDSMQNNIAIIYQWCAMDLVHHGAIQPEVSIHVLASIMGYILQIKNEILNSEIVFNLAWDLSNLVLVVFKNSTEYRSLIIRVLLPVLLSALNEIFYIEIFVQGKQYILSRSNFLKESWECCASLFSLGNNIERLHAYNILSLCFSFFSKSDSKGDKSNDFYLNLKKEFWVEIRKGLVCKDSSIRKRALYLLKSSLNHYFTNFLTGTKTTSTGTSTGTVPETKRERYFNKEAKSMGVGDLSNLNGTCLSIQDKWRVFVLLYEMLDEYGTHLVEAAWTHQVDLLIKSTSENNNKQDNLIQMDNLETIFYWMTVLWERGFSHENPQVRCLIMESFLGIKWEKQNNCAHKVPIDFILGPLMHALNDVVHHKDFGIGGIYNSKTINGATKFFRGYSSQLSLSDRLFIVWSMASVSRHDNFGRAGLMTLSFCISSFSCTVFENMQFNACTVFDADKTVSTSDVLDALGIVIERSKQHFNQHYRLQVCEKVLETTSCLISATDLPLDLILHFLSSIPREFTDIMGPLRSIVQKWLVSAFSTESIIEFLNKFIIKSNLEENEIFNNYFDDEDSIAWEAEALRWARLVLILVPEKQFFDHIFKFIERYGNGLKELNCNSKWTAIKFLIIIISVIEELQRGFKKLDKSDYYLDFFPPICKNLTALLLSIMDKLVGFAESATLILFTKKEINADLPLSIKGKLGGPSQRRLPLSITPSVLHAVLLLIFAMKTISYAFSWCYKFKENDDDLKNSLNFLCDFTWRVIQSPTVDTEIGAEVHLASFEALTFVLKSLSVVSPIQNLMISYITSGQSNGTLGRQNDILENSLDPLAVGFLESINILLENGALTRSRRAVLICYKWHCMEAILSIPYNTEKIAKDEIHKAVLSDSTLRAIFLDTIESLENAGESSVLSILKCVRLIFGLIRKDCESNSSSWLNFEMVMQLVKSSWIMHQSCNKRRVAPIAALLSAILHPNIFYDLKMHESNGDKQGPLKWFIEKLLNEGAKSPRTIRLTALHLTGLFLKYPKTMKYYIKELMLLSLYGSVAFDEDFEGELSENQEARYEVSLLAQSPDLEFTQAFINTELYARVSVAVLFYKFAQISNLKFEFKSEDYSAAFNSGKQFLLELLDSAVNDKDLSKELYKKYSSVHRRKVRAWQMICVLSHFVEEDIVQEVTSNLHICLYRSNLPAVRQYLEILGIQIYLKFPNLAEQQLIPIFRDYSMRTQALSSYVFIAANVILYSKDNLQINHLKNLLPPIIPLLTSHHHSLRGFTQLLVHIVLNKMWPLLGLSNLEISSFERKSFENLKSYLAQNTDCARLRASMEGFFENFDPDKSSSPAGVFSTTHEGSDFECAPVSLMDQIIDFLNEVRDDLRHNIAKDLATIKSESLSISDFNLNGEKSQFNDLTLDFQKKITLDIDNSDSQFPNLLGELEKEDELFNLVLKSRNEALERIKQSQQNIILVASLIDRIPNLAGLARTCEVFKAAGLTIADTSVLQDKQFQLISVTAEKWVPIMEVPVNTVKLFLEQKRKQGYSLIGLEQTANSNPLDKFSFPNKTVLVLGKEKEGIPVEIIHMLDACVEIPQFGIIRSLNVHVSAAIAVWEYTRQQRLEQSTLTLL